MWKKSSTVAQACISCSIVPGGRWNSGFGRQETDPKESSVKMISWDDSSGRTY